MMLHGDCAHDWVMGLGENLPKPTIPVILFNMVPIRVVGMRTGR
jgi:hypothetical protein